MHRNIVSNLLEQIALSPVTEIVFYSLFNLSGDACCWPAKWIPSSKYPRLVFLPIHIGGMRINLYCLVGVYVGDISRLSLRCRLGGLDLDTRRQWQLEQCVIHVNEI